MNQEYVVGVVIQTLVQLVVGGGQRRVACMNESVVSASIVPRGERITRWWGSCSLAQQFAVVGSLVVVCGMVIIGAWVAKEIEGAVTRNTAASTALYMDSFIAPHVQELAQQDHLSVEHQVALEELFVGTELGKRIVSAKVWKQGGLIAYSTRKSIIGKKFPITANLRLAWGGGISAEFDDLKDEEDALERSDGVPYLEMYSPIRESLTGRVIAVAEFYEAAGPLKQALFNAQLGSWIVVAIVTLTMIGLLSSIVLKGSRTIEQQRSSLEERVGQLSVLRDRLEHSSRLATVLNERFLRRIGSELHDGPSQLIGLALLRLDSIAQPTSSSGASSATQRDDFEVVRGALNDALKEIRTLSAGLVLPEFDNRSLKEGLLRIVAMHEKRTDTTVVRDLGELPEQVNNSIKISLFRMVQEGLNNAFRHAPEGRVSVHANYDGRLLEIKVSDEGPGFDAIAPVVAEAGLGLPGLRERMESIGGSFEVRSSSQGGTTLTAQFALGEQ